MPSLFKIGEYINKRRGGDPFPARFAQALCIFCIGRLLPRRIYVWYNPSRRNIVINVQIRREVGVWQTYLT